MSDNNDPNKSKKALKVRAPRQQTLPILSKHPRHHYAGGLNIYKMKGDRRERISASTADALPGKIGEGGVFVTRGYKVSAAINPKSKLFQPTESGTITNAVIVIDCPYPLGATELRCMHSILGHLGMRDPERVVRISQEPKSELGKELKTKLDYAPQAGVPDLVHQALPFFREPEVIRVKMSYNDLVETAGMTISGERQKQVAASLAALERANVQYFIEGIDNEGRKVAFQSQVSPLIRRTTVSRELAPGSDRMVTDVYVSVDPHIIRSISTDGEHRIISLDEMRKLKREASILLHNYLGGFIDPGGHPVKVSLDKMVAAIFTSDPSGRREEDPRVMIKRRGLVRDAIAELIGIGWTFQPLDGQTRGNIVYFVRRPRPKSLDVIALGPASGPEGTEI